LNFIFNGPPGSGKDEACHFLKTNYGYKHLQFKDELFRATAQFYDVSLDWFLDGYDDRVIKERPDHRLDGFSRRGALIYVSEEIIKPRYGKDYFGVKTSEKVDLSADYCFSDGGFVEEVLPLINKIGRDKIRIVQLYRTGCSFTSDSRNYIDGILTEEFGHNNSDTLIQKSEPKIPIRMYKIHNNTSVSDFHQMIIKILRKEANANSKDADFQRKSI
jgi:hypothetical protein